MERRAFLRIAAGTPLIFGLDDLFAAQDEVPAWYADALKRMKETGRHGMVIVVPDDESARAEWAEHLVVLVDSGGDDLYEVIGLAVLVCVTPAVAAKTVRKGGSKDNRFLLDPDGKTVSSATITMASLKPEAFVKESKELLHGDRLKTSAEAMLKDAPDSVKAALEKLASESLEVRDEARGVLEAKADSIFPLLVWTRLNSKSLDVTSSIRAIVRAWTAGANPRIPFGAKVEMVQRDPCPRCGMAEAPAKARKVMTFLAK